MLDHAPDLPKHTVVKAGKVKSLGGNKFTFGILIIIGC